MPTGWVAAEVAVEHGGWKVFHIYKDDHIDQPRDYWFAMHDDGCDGGDDSIFDVRELETPTLDGRPPELEDDVWLQLRRGVESGEIPRWHGTIHEEVGFGLRSLVVDLRGPWAQACSIEDGWPDARIEGWDTPSIWDEQARLYWWPDDPVTIRRKVGGRAISNYKWSVQFNQDRLPPQEDV